MPLRAQIDRKTAHLVMPGPGFGKGIGALFSLSTWMGFALSMILNRLAGKLFGNQLGQHVGRKLFYFQQIFCFFNGFLRFLIYKPAYITRLPMD